MRKAQKQEVLEIVQTLHQAHDEIKNSIEKKNYVLARDILSQCQECAISLGTVIEKLEGEGFITISYVEAYCDIVFLAYEELNETYVNANKIHKSLKKQLLRIENSIKNDVPIRKEIVFFPYKVSMWDSLESVYLKAKQDPNCDVYCVPIPYYDRNPDKSLGKMHYEGRQYPENIEVIDWQTYNFEDRKPDVVYIHNPYDDWNLVTCVHPRYFSANLKRYTRELVYIPYFVLNEIEPNDQVRIDGMKHFCFLPGVVNADTVIVQSEKMKQIYVNEYVKAAQLNGLGGYHLDRNKLNKKFLGIGSPKFEKVLNIKKEDYQIPKEWLKIVEKSDGSWKKIIFYNTSIGSLLEQNEKMLEKMKYVFDVFQENREEVALLWRPHPLIESTVSSMRPQLWIEYEKLVEQYRQEGWGIYDDTAEADRAMAISDAYYGDASSLVPLYQKTKKSVMLQNVHTKVFDWDELICGKGMCINGTYMWMTMTMMNALVKIDLETGETECCGNFGDIYLDKYNHVNLFCDALAYGESIYFAPTRANAISVYDRCDGTIANYKVEIPDQFVRNIPNYAIAVPHEDEMIFVGICQTNAIMRFNVKNKKAEYYGQIINGDVRYMKKPAYGTNAVIVDGKMYVPLKGEGSLYVLDLITNREEILCIDEKQREFNTINYQDRIFYITTSLGELLKWRNGNIIEKKLLYEGVIYTSICTDKYLWLFPRNAEGEIQKYNLKADEIEEIAFSYNVYDVYEDKMSGMLLLNTRGGIGVLNPITNQIERKKYKAKGVADIKEVIELWDDETNRKKGIMEGAPEYNTLHEYIKEIVGGE